VAGGRSTSRKASWRSLRASDGEYDPAVAATIDVVVPVYNHYALTSDCLSHLGAQTVAHRAIVVDDGSSDGTPAYLREQWPRVTLIEQGDNGGYARAVNSGVRAGDGEHVVLLNNDVRVAPDFLERLTEPLRAAHDVGSVASVMLASDEAKIDSVGVTADVTLAGFARLQGRPRVDASRHTPLLTGPEGTAGAYRRAAWEQVGGFDERLRAYMEVLDLALRLAAGGWRTACATGAVGVHLGSQTYGRRSRTQRRLAGFSRGYLLRRYGVLRSRAATRTLLTETVVAAADAAICRDLQASLGRMEGWRAAAGAQRHPWPPPGAIDETISLRESFRLRRGALGDGPPA
jgi:N-acetylglucosaminyl-diphospho-decaprenol L-rhamnosyltransferase